MTRTRLVVAVLDATCGPDGVGPKHPPGGLASWAHRAEHPTWVDGCAACLTRRRESPFAGHGPSTGGPAWAWIDVATGRGGWEDGHPPVECGRRYEVEVAPTKTRRELFVETFERCAREYAAWPAWMRSAISTANVATFAPHRPNEKLDPPSEVE